MADNLLFEISNESQISNEPFVQRQVVYISDLNGGSYTGGQILLNSSSISNAGRFCDFSSSYLEIPLVISLTNNGFSASPNNTVAGGVGSQAGVVAGNTAFSNAVFNALPLAFSCGLKAGYWNIISQMSITYNNTVVSQLCPYLNFYTNFKMLTTLSVDDVKKFGTSIGFVPDGSLSFSFNNGALNSGNDAGLLNTVLTPTNLNYPQGWIPRVQAEGGSCNNLNMGTNQVSGHYEAVNYIVANVANGASPVQNTGGALNAGSQWNYLLTVISNDELSSPLTNNIAEVSNLGFYERQKSISFDPTQTPFSNLVNTQNIGNVGKNYYSATTQQGTVCWFVMAKIRMKDISDFFNQLPLIRGSFISLQIFVNAPTTHTISFSSIPAGATYLTSGNYIGCTNTTIQGTSSPLMFASCTYGNGNWSLYNALFNPDLYGYGGTNAMQDSITTGAGAYSCNFTLACYIAKNTALNISHPTLQQVRWYCPLYQMSAESEMQYLSLNEIKKVVYHDIYEYTITNISGSTNQSVSQILSNGVVNPKYLILIPMISASSNPVASNNGTQTQTFLAPYQSPFSSCPATTDMIILSNISVQLAGVNVWTSNEIYDFQQFADELSELGLNGGRITGLSSGLIGESDFQYNKRFYVCNLGRNVPMSEKGVPKSVSVNFQNLSNVSIDVFCFIEYEREISIRMEDGSLVEQK